PQLRSPLIGCQRGCQCPIPHPRREPRHSQSGARPVAPAMPAAPPTTAPIALPIPGCSPATVGTAANSSSLASGVRILILSFGVSNGASSATLRWAADRDLKVPTTAIIGDLLCSHGSNGC